MHFLKIGFLFFKFLNRETQFTILSNILRDAKFSEKKNIYISPEDKFILDMKTMRSTKRKSYCAIAHTIS